MESTIEKGRRGKSTASNKSTSPNSSASTKTAAQELRILNALRKRHTLTTDQLRELGCYQASARIFGLRAKGYNIETELFTGHGADGYTHARMARYRLIGGPEHGGVQ